MAEPKAMKPIDEVRSNIQSMATQFKAALPPHINPDKFMRVAITAIQNSPDLLAADRHSLYGACVRLAQEGLLPDNREAALVIFNKNVGTKDAPKWAKMVQAMPMVAGILKKCRNSGEMTSPTLQVIHGKDKFRYWVDANGEHLEHEPNLFEDRGLIIGFYSLVKFKDNTISIEVMTKAEVDKVRAASKTSKFGPWADWYEEMGKKTVFRRHSKRLPMSTDLEQFLREEDENLGIELDDPEPPPAPVSTKPTKLGQIIDAQASQPEVVEHEAATPTKDELPI